VRPGIRLPVAVALLLASPLLVAQSTRFRLTDLDLRDPHVWAIAITCTDLTDLASVGVNAQIQTSIQGDADGNGILDASTLLEFLPLDQSAATNLFDAGGADCTAPAATTTCGPIVAPLLAGNASLSTSATCGQPLAGTTRPYVPGIVNATAPCFASVTGTLILNLGGTPVTLTDAQIAATFVGNPATSVSNGLMRGFLSEADANATIIPATVPLIGGRPLSSVLPGGPGACPAFSDKDTGPGGVIGWYFYLNFPAQRLNEDPFSQGFADGFE
jgi:hypothetical protein